MQWQSGLRGDLDASQRCQFSAVQQTEFLVEGRHQRPTPSRAPHKRDGALNCGRLRALGRSFGRPPAVFRVRRAGWAPGPRVRVARYTGRRLRTSDKEQRVFGLRLVLGDHGTADRHDQRDNAIDPLRGLVLGRLEVAGGSWATATLAAIPRVTGLPPCASFFETINFSSSRVGAAMERNPCRNSTIAAPSSCRRSAMWVASRGRRRSP